MSAKILAKRGDDSLVLIRIRLFDWTTEFTGFIVAMETTRAERLSRTTPTQWDFKEHEIIAYLGEDGIEDKVYTEALVKFGLRCGHQ